MIDDGLPVPGFHMCLNCMHVGPPAKKDYNELGPAHCAGCGSVRVRWYAGLPGVGRLEYLPGLRVISSFAAGVQTGQGGGI